MRSFIICTLRKYYRLIKSRLTRNVDGELKKVYKISGGIHEEQKPLEAPSCRSEYNIKVGLERNRM
jgi:hypothetical protein